MIAAAAVLLVSLIGLFTIDESDSSLAATTDRTTTTETAPAGDDNPAFVDTTVAGSATTAAPSATTRPQSSTTIANVPDPGATRPPAPGVYVYAFTTAADPSANGDRDFKIESLPAENGAPAAPGDVSEAQNSTVTQEQTWAADAVRMTRTQIVAPQATVDCTWKPPLVVVRLPLTVGKTWTSDSTCTTMAQGVQVTIRQATTSKVTGKFLDKVGNVSVPTWVIESTGTASAKTPFGNVDTAVTSLTRFAADRGLVTYDKEVGKGPTSSYERERLLKSFSPR